MLLCSRSKIQAIWINSLQELFLREEVRCETFTAAGLNLKPGWMSDWISNERPGLQKE